MADELGVEDGAFLKDAVMNCIQTTREALLVPAVQRSPELVDTLGKLLKLLHGLEGDRSQAKAKALAKESRPLSHTRLIEGDQKQLAAIHAIHDDVKRDQKALVEVNGLERCRLMTRIQARRLCPERKLTMENDKENLKSTLWSLDMNASLNEHYYQKLTWLFAATDRAIRIIVAILAIMSLVFAADANTSWWISFCTLAVAVVLNILPVHQWELDCYVLQNQWGELRGDIQQFEIAVYDALVDLTFLVRTKRMFQGGITKPQTERLAEIVIKRNTLNSKDRIRWQWLIDRTWREESQRRYGKGVVTAEQQQEAAEKLKRIYESQDNNAVA